jgi:hypothetical protein
MGLFSNFERAGHHQSTLIVTIAPNGALSEYGKRVLGVVEPYSVVQQSLTQVKFTVF